MAYIQFTPDELAINAGALALRQYAEANLHPTTYAWLDSFTYSGQRDGQTGIGIKPNARAIAPQLPEFIAGGNALSAWTCGIQGSRAIATQSPAEFPFVGPETWQERLSREVAAIWPDKVPTLDELRARYEALSPQPAIAEICRHVGIDQRHHVNITNAFNGQRSSIPAPQRQQLGSWLKG